MLIPTYVGTKHLADLSAVALAKAEGALSIWATGRDLPDRLYIVRCVMLDKTLGAAESFNDSLR